jgi:dihydroneopterin aldolase
MGKIRLEGIEIYAHHGFYKEEQKLGNHFRLDIEMVVDTEGASKSDDLSKTVNYQAVYETVKKEMKQKAKLLENITGRIADGILKNFPMVKNVKVKLAKLNPPIKGNIQKVSVEISRKRK